MSLVEGIAVDGVAAGDLITASLVGSAFVSGNGIGFIVSPWLGNGCNENSVGLFSNWLEKCFMTGIFGRYSGSKYARPDEIKVSFFVVI